MKKIICMALISVASFPVFAQDRNGENGGGVFKKENLFTGGSVTASFFNGSTVLGVSPYFGYSLNKFIDLAVSLNFNYISQRDFVEYGDKVRQTIFAPGAFARLFPVRFLFGEAKFEHNFIRLKYIPAPNSFRTKDIRKVEANSLLVGGGYTSGRYPGNNTYYYLTILWDMTRSANSPYVDNLGRSIPIITAGYNIALFQGRHH